jgi:hypothetical protein
MTFLGRLQKLSEKNKKIILWTTIIVVGLCMFTLWIINFQKRIKDFELEEFKKGLNLPSFEEKELPKLNEE